MERKRTQIPLENVDITQYQKSVRLTIAGNRADIAAYVEKESLRDNSLLFNPFSMEGSVIVDTPPNNPHLSTFFEMEGRTYQSARGTELRGYRYYISVDETLDSNEVLAISMQDMKDACATVEKLKSANIEPDDLPYLLGLFDFIKNSHLLLLHAYIYEEKCGEFNFENTEYLESRDFLVSNTRKAIQNYYGLLCDSNSISEVINTCEPPDQQSLERSFKNIEGKDRSHLVLPECSHPLTILGTAFLSVQRSPEIDTVVSPPCGGTELGFVTQAVHRRLHNHEPDLLLLPLSLHTGQRVLQRTLEEACIREYLEKHRSALEGKSVLVVDDNSSSGETLGVLSQHIEMLSPRTLRVTAAEADIIRTEINTKEVQGCTAADPSLYKDSCNVLPISKMVWPKRDLRKLKILRVAKQHWERKAQKSNDAHEQMVAKIRADVQWRPGRRLIAEPKDETITDFRKTVLSNFYPLQVHHDGQTYPTSEHAYQSAKFDLGNIEMTPEQERILAENIPNMDVDVSITLAFTCDKVSPGRIKKISSFLSDWGYQREDWNSDMKLRTMCEILLTKFSDPQASQALKETGDKILVEDNNWGDTFWGISDEKGLNYLGRILMLLRDGDIM